MRINLLKSAAILSVVLLIGCTARGGIEDITLPELEPRPVPRENAFIGSLPPPKRLESTILVRISFLRDSVDAAIKCDHLFQEFSGKKCTYACAFGSVVGNAPAVYIEKPLGRNEWERKLLRLIDEKGFSAYWLVGPQGEIDYPKGVSRYNNLFNHEVGGHGWQWLNEGKMNHDGFY